MRGRGSVCLVLVTGVGLAAGCGEELAEREVEPAAPPAALCELIDPSDLQQIFVNELTLDADAASTESCTWNDAATGEAFLQYEVLPYSEDLRARVRTLEAEQGEPIDARTVQGVGDAAVWTDLGLFVNRNGRTLRILPAGTAGDRAPYQELARLLLTRMEAG